MGLNVNSMQTKLVRNHKTGNGDKNHTGISNHRMSSWFCSHPVRSYPRDQEWMTDPYQDRPSFHLTFSP